MRKTTSRARNHHGLMGWRIGKPRGPVEPQRHGDADDQRLRDVHVRVVEDLVEVEADQEERA